jgi:hypothetical protein
LRITADCLANITPNLYGELGRKKQGLPRGRFREQRKWFTSPDGRDFDPNYTTILEKYTGWFDVLAGKGDKDYGLRDKIIHHRGTWQFRGYYEPPIETIELAAGLYGDSGWIIDDIMPELTTIVFELCLFLDQFVTHFNARIGEEIGSEPVQLSNPFHTELYRFDEPPSSLWLFPRVQRIGGQ